MVGKKRSNDDVKEQKARKKPRRDDSGSAEDDESFELQATIVDEANRLIVYLFVSSWSLIVVETAAVVSFTAAWTLNICRFRMA